MQIGALQKTTLLDYPGHIACTVFLPGCNLRCPYCHNPAMVLPGRIAPELSQQELFAFLQKRRGILDGVCITGGEPTLHRDLPELIRSIRELGFLVMLDTNGTNPHMLEQLLREGLLSYVAMDIKNAPELYPVTCGGIDLLEPVRRSAALLMEEAPDYEFRTTVCAPLHTPEAMARIGRWLHGAKRYFLQSFVDSGDLVGSGVRALTEQELSALRQAVLEDIPNTRIRGI